MSEINWEKYIETDYDLALHLKNMEDDQRERKQELQSIRKKLKKVCSLLKEMEERYEG